MLLDGSLWNQFSFSNIKHDEESKKQLNSNKKNARLILKGEEINDKGISSKTHSNGIGHVEYHRKCSAIIPFARKRNAVAIVWHIENTTHTPVASSCVCVCVLCWCTQKTTNSMANRNYRLVLLMHIHKWCPHLCYAMVIAIVITITIPYTTYMMLFIFQKYLSLRIFRVVSSLSAFHQCHIFRFSLFISTQTTPTSNIHSLLQKIYSEIYICIEIPLCPIQQ